MIQCREVWLPDGDTHMVEYLSKVPRVDGRGAYQDEKWRQCRPHIKQWRTALDIGAHVGLWTMTLAKHFQRVVCFEPMPHHLECWFRNLPLMGFYGEGERGAWRSNGVFEVEEVPTGKRLVLHPVALGQEPGEVQLGLERAGWSGCVCVVSQGTHKPIAGDPVTAQMRRLDDYDLHDVDFVKVDCEGFEQFVLRGGEAMLKRERPTVIVEQKPGLATKYGLDEIGAVKYLQSLGAKRHWTMAGDYLLTFPEVAR